MSLSNYKLIDGGISLERQKLYDLLDYYFDSPSLEKIKDDGAVAIYMCKINTLLASPEQRYLIAMTSHDSEEIGKIVSLDSIKWKSLQTRLLTNVNPKLHRHSYAPKNTKSYHIPIRLIERYPDRTEYYIDENTLKEQCIVSVLHSNPDQRMQYPDKSTIPSAIESYRTLFLVKDIKDI